MKKFTSILFACIISHTGFCQLEFKNSNVGRLANFYDQTGNSLVKTYSPDIVGSPFFNNDWTLAKLSLLHGTIVQPLAIKLNIESNALYFLDSTGKERVALDGLVKKIEGVAPASDGLSFVFKCGYPAIDQQNENYYYRVLAEGEIELLMKVYKYIRVSKNELTGDAAEEFLEGSRLYAYGHNAIQIFESNKNFVLALMKDKEKEMNAFLDSNKINLKKTADLIKLFIYYNGLKQ